MTAITKILTPTCLTFLVSVVAVLVAPAFGNGQRQHETRWELSMEEYRLIHDFDGDLHFFDSEDGITSAHDQWYAALDYEWKRALAVEAKWRRRLQAVPLEPDQQTGQEATGDDEEYLDEFFQQFGGSDIIGSFIDGPDLELSSSDGSSPYMVCDLAKEKKGSKSFKKVMEFFGSSNFINSINQDDRICYILVAPASTAISSNDFMSSDQLSSTPLLSEMKIEQGTTDTILNGEESPIGINGVFCPTESIQSRDTGEKVLNEVLQYLMSDIDHVVRHRILRSRGTRNPHAHDQLERHLLNTSSGKCLTFLEAITMEVEESGVNFDVYYPVDMIDSQTKRDCLLTVALAVASHDAVCRVGVMPVTATLNEAAVWIAQSNVPRETPFFDVGLNGTGQVAQVSDSGLDQTHCSFRDPGGAIQASTVSQINLGKRKVIQYTYNKDGGADKRDTSSGHGTHVVGSLLGYAPGKENKNLNGAAPGARVAFYDAGNAKKPGAIYAPSNIEGRFLNYGYEAGARVHSASWGGSVGSRLIAAVGRYDRFMYNHDDFLLLAAAGNSGNDGYHTVLFPAVSKNGIAVGAAKRGGARDELTGYSSRGPTEDGRIKPEVCATGTVYSANALSGCGTVGKSGTSMATPITSGTALQIRQYFTEGFYPGGFKGSSSLYSNPSAALVKAELMIGARKLLSAPKATRGTDEYDMFQGFGSIHLIRSLPLMGVTDFQNRVFDRVKISEGEEHSYWVKIDENAGSCTYDELRVMLVWTDRPNTNGCTTSCVLNHLDLLVTGAEGDHHFPNGLKSRPDTQNVAERVVIETPSNGDMFEVRVSAPSFVQGGIQKYALVINGCLADDMDFSPPAASLPTLSPIETEEFIIRTEKDTYQVGEPIDVEYVNNGFLHARDFVGLWRDDTDNVDNLMRYRFTCGMDGKICDSGRMRIDQEIGSSFVAWKGDEGVWPLPVGTYAVSLNLDRTIRAVVATSSFEVVEGSVTARPSDSPDSEAPSFEPSASVLPSTMPSLAPSESSVPSTSPSMVPSESLLPSLTPSSHPSQMPSLSNVPSVTPTQSPSSTKMPTARPSESAAPSFKPSQEPSLSNSPSIGPTLVPSESITPSFVPSSEPSYTPSTSNEPSFLPSGSAIPTITPSSQPSDEPSISDFPSMSPTDLGAFITTDQLSYTVDEKIRIEYGRNALHGPKDSLALYEGCDTSTTTGTLLGYRASCTNSTKGKNTFLSCDEADDTFEYDDRSDDFDIMGWPLTPSIYTWKFSTTDDDGMEETLAETHFTVSMDGFSIFPSKLEYTVGEPWLMDYESDVNLGKEDFIGIYSGCMMSDETLMAYHYPCLDQDTCDINSGTVSYDGTDSDNFKSNDNGVSFLPEGLYLVTLTTDDQQQAVAFVEVVGKPPSTSPTLMPSESITPSFIPSSEPSAKQTVIPSSKPSVERLIDFFVG